MPPTLLCIKPKMPGATGLNPAWDARREPATGVPPPRTAISGCNSLIFGVEKIDPAEGRPYLALEPPARPTTVQDLLRPARCDAKLRPARGFTDQRGSRFAEVSSRSGAQDPCVWLRCACRLAPRR